MGLQDRAGSPDGILSAARAVKLFSLPGSAGEGNPKSFHSLLRKFRKRLQISQRKMASRLGVTQSAVARWESGESLPKREMFLQERADTRAVGLGPLADFPFRLCLSLSPSEWERLAEAYLTAESRLSADPRKKTIRALSRLGRSYSVKPRPEHKSKPGPSTPRVHRYRAVKTLKNAFILDQKGCPVSEELLSRALASAKEADSLFLLSGLTRRSGNEVYGGFKKKVLRAVLEVFSRNPRRKAGRPSGS